MTVSYRACLPQELDIVWIDHPDDQQSNIEFDDVLAGEVARGQRAPTLRLWSGGRWPAIAVSHRDVQGELGVAAAHALRRTGCDVFVRGTGGTAAPQGPGVLQASLLLPRRPLRATTDDYYRMFCDVLMSWLGGYKLAGETGALPGSYCDGTYNVLVRGRKLIGTAQAWRGGLAGLASVRPGYIIVHGCITVDVDLAEASAWINRFYALASNAYRVQSEAAVTLRELLPHEFERDSEVRARMRVARDLQARAASHFERLGVSCRASDLGPAGSP